MQGDSAGSARSAGGAGSAWGLRVQLKIQPKQQIKNLVARLAGTGLPFGIHIQSSTLIDVAGLLESKMYRKPNISASQRPWVSGMGNPPSILKNNILKWISHS